MAQAPPKGWTHPRLANVKRKQILRKERRHTFLREWLGTGKKDGMSYRDIAEKHGVSRQTVMLDVNQAISEMSEELMDTTAVDVKKEFTEQLRFAKKLRQAAEDWLMVGGDVSLDAREHEVEVVYLDRNDLDEKGKPVKKKALLSEIMEMIHTEALEPVKANVETLDKKFALEYALKTISSTDIVIDKFARILGEYTREKPNSAEAVEIARQVVVNAVAEGMEKAEAVKRASERYGVLEADLVS